MHSYPTDLILNYTLQKSKATDQVRRVPSISILRRRLTPAAGNAPQAHHPLFQSPYQDRHYAQGSENEAVPYPQTIVFSQKSNHRRTNKEADVRDGCHHA